jgi:hypothetical protein
MYGARDAGHGEAGGGTLSVHGTSHVVDRKVESEGARVETVGALELSNVVRAAVGGTYDVAELQTAGRPSMWTSSTGSWNMTQIDGDRDVVGVEPGDALCHARAGRVFNTVRETVP